jgi:hypothetical protein
MAEDHLGPIEPRRWRYPAPPVCTAQWDETDWQRWAEMYGSLEPLTIKTAFGVRRAVGRNVHGELVYRLNVEGEP